MIEEATPDIHKILNPVKVNADHGFREDLSGCLVFSSDGFNKLRVHYSNVLVCSVNCICNRDSLKLLMLSSYGCAHSSINEEGGPGHKF